MMKKAKNNKKYQQNIPKTKSNVEIIKIIY